MFLNITEYNEYHSINNEESNLNDNDDYLFSDILFECQCVLYFIDISNKASFEYIKRKDKNINAESYLTKVIVLNKSDLTSEVSEEDINQFAGEAGIKNVIKLSLKTNENYTQILELIYQILYENKNDLAVNIVYDITKSKRFYNLNDAKKRLLRIVLLGDTQVGKTCFLQRYFNDKFLAKSMASIGITDDSKFIKIGETTCVLKLWDTAGQEKFKSLPKSFYQNADGLLLIYDVTKQDTFDNIANWMKNIRDNLGGIEKTSKKYPIIYLLANKIDSEERVVRKEDAEEKVKEFDMEYYEVSAKLNVNIFEVIMKMANAIFIKNGGVNMGINLDNKGKTEKKKCCK